MTTIREVAKAAKVSIASVSRVLNNQGGVSDDVRDRVLEAVNRCGYVATVGRRNTAYLGLVYTGATILDSPYDSAILAGITSAMDECAFDLVVINLHGGKQPSESYTQFFLRKGIRGVILRTTRQTRNVCEAIADEGFPAIVIGERFEREDLNYVRGDSLPASEKGIEHLIALGHRKIAIAIADIVLDSDHSDRMVAYRRVLKAHTINDDPRMHCHIPASRPDGAQVIRKMMSMSEPPTAVVFTDPLVAVGALNEAHRLGVRVPQDLSILGFDDAEMRYQVFPAMTAVCQDARRLGYEAFRMLAQFADGIAPAGPFRQEFPTWLEINGTTGETPSGHVRVLPDGTRLSST